jgi:uncharacterized protein (DUF697 family)/GTPase SAR1 family protein
MAAPPANPLAAEYERQIKGVASPTIAALGSTGAGKTSLLNTLFGVDFGKTGHGKPITPKWTAYPPSATCPIRLYDTKGIEPGSDASEEYERDTLGEIAALAKDVDIANHIHIIVFVLSAAAGRLTAFDIATLSGPALRDVPKVFALNKVDLASDAQIAACEQCIIDANIPTSCAIARTCSSVTEGVSKHPHACPQCGGKEFMTSSKTRKWTCETCGEKGALVSRGHGLGELERAITDALPLALKNAFVVAQQVNAGRKVEASCLVVAGASMTCAAIGAAPIPVADIIGMTAAQVAMVATLLYIWGHDPRDRSLIAGLGAQQTFVGSVGKGLASLLKMIPGVGTITGGVINAAIGGTFTGLQGVITTVVMNVIFEAKVQGAVGGYTEKQIAELWAKVRGVLDIAGTAGLIRGAITGGNFQEALAGIAGQAIAAVAAEGVVAPAAGGDGGALVSPMEM